MVSFCPLRPFLTRSLFCPLYLGTPFVIGPPFFGRRENGDVSPSPFFSARTLRPWSSFFPEAPPRDRGANQLSSVFCVSSPLFLSLQTVGQFSCEDLLLSATVGVLVFPSEEGPPLSGPPSFGRLTVSVGSSFPRSQLSDPVQVSTRGRGCASAW